MNIEVTKTSTKKLSKKVMPHFVVFADVMGTKNRIRKCAKNFKKLDRELNQFYDVIDSNVELLKIVESFKGNVKIFSDSILISVPILSDPITRKFDDGRAEIAIPIIHIAGFQYSLMLKGFPLRGGCSIGHGFADSKISFGPVIIDAWETEENNIYPAIFLDPRVVTLLNYYLKLKYPGFDDGPFNWIISDSTGRHFINYLYFIFEMAKFNAELQETGFTNDSLFDFNPDAKSELLLHKEIIETHLSDPELFEKYFWLACYHNFFCTKYLPNPEIFLISDGTKFDFTIIGTDIS